MGSLYSVNCSVKYFICLIDNFTKYFWAKPFMNKKVKRDFYGFIEKVNEPKLKPNILWFDEGR